LQQVLLGHLAKRMNFNDLKIVVNGYGLWHDMCPFLESASAQNYHQTYMLIPFQENPDRF
jgi:hypothetical protein